MVGATDLLASGTGVGAGVGSTIVVRQQLDQTGETTVFRPSVLWGVGTGLIGLAVPAAMRMMGNHPRRGVGMELLEDYSEAALAAGVFSAFSPKGGSVQVPTLS